MRALIKGVKRTGLTLLPGLIVVSGSIVAPTSSLSVVVPGGAEPVMVFIFVNTVFDTSNPVIVRGPPGMSVRTT